MRDRRLELADQLSDALIRADIVFWGSVGLNYQRSSFQSIAIQALLPFASMFVYESLRRQNLPLSELDFRFGVNAPYVKSARHRVKLLDGKSLPDVLKAAQRIADSEREAFQAPHSGWRRSWRRRFQPDLGLLFVGERLVATSHSTLLSIALASKPLPDHTDLSQLMFKFGDSLGNHLIDFISLTGVSVQDMVLPGEPPPVRYTDVKAEQFVTLIAERIAPTQNAVCLFLLAVNAHLNTARYLVPVFAKNSELSTLKLYVVSLFHAVSSLNRLLAVNRGNALLSSSTAISIQEALSHPSLSRNKETRALRNALVHYRIEDRFVMKLSSSLPYSGLVEVHAPGATFDSLSRNIQTGLDHLSESMHNLLFADSIRSTML